MTAAPKYMTADEFLQWREGRAGRWELVAGVPVRMMAGAKQRHDDIVVNLISALGPMLRGGECRPRTADIAVRIPGGDVRQPDVTIDCGPRDDDALEARGPAVVFEVLSPSTRAYDQVRKVEEYERVETMRHIVLIDPEQPRVTLWGRESAHGSWADEEITGLDASLTLKAVGIEADLRTIYEDVELDDGA